MASRQTFRSFRLDERSGVKFGEKVIDAVLFRYLTVPERLHAIALLERYGIEFTSYGLDSALISLIQSENHLRHDCILQIEGRQWFGSALCSLPDYKNAKDRIVKLPLRREAEAYLKAHFQAEIVKDNETLQRRKNENKFKYLERCMENSSFKADWNRYIHAHYKGRKEEYMEKLIVFLADRGGRIAMSRALAAPSISA